MLRIKYRTEKSLKRLEKSNKCVDKLRGMLYNGYISKARQDRPKRKDD